MWAGNFEIITRFNDAAKSFVDPHNQYSVILAIQYRHLWMELHFMAVCISYSVKPEQKGWLPYYPQVFDFVETDSSFKKYGKAL